MKNLISAALISSLFTLSCTQTSTSSGDSFTINGQIEGLENGSVIVLTPIATYKDEKPIAFDTIRNGKFKLEGKLDETRLFSIRAENHYGGYDLLISNENVSFKGKFSSVSNERYSSCSFDDVKIKGASLQNEYLSKIKVREDMDKLYKEYTSKFAEFNKSFGEARQNNDTLKVRELAESETYAELIKAESDFFNTVQESYTNLIKANGNSFFGPMLMLNLMSYFGDEQKSWYENFSEEAKESYYGKIVKDELYPVGLKGQKVPELSCEIDGKNVNIIADNLGKKYTIIDFWASWCAPCRKEIPNLKAAYDKYASKGLEIISISIDKNEKDWQKALNEEKLKWPNYIDNKDFAEIYKIKFVPTVYLVDGNGVLIEENIKGEALITRLEELFEN